MKKRFATIILASVLGVTGMGLTACTPSPNDLYTGDAVISGVRYRSMQKYQTSACIATVTFPDGKVDSRRLSVNVSEGKRAGCAKVKTGGKITLVNGQVVSFETQD